jgi:hypothetical protein
MKTAFRIVLIVAILAVAFICIRHTPADAPHVEGTLDNILR